ncbi:MAG: glycoside hydrolase family protein [Shewanella sp.]
MTTIAKLLKYEEGYRAKPYYCSENYPTIGIGLRIGPKGAPLSQYEMDMPVQVAECWLQCYVDNLMADMYATPTIKAAMHACDSARVAVLVSMGYQLGVKGLAGFKNTLKAVAEKRWDDAAKGMLDSKWAKQTPARAQRHAEQMRTGVWFGGY